MRAPEFWRGRGVLSSLLLPAGLIYAAATRRRVARAPACRLPVPVICAGNLGAGGSGKTPVAMAIAERLGVHGADAHFLSRGYRGRLSGPVQVDPSVHGFRDVGDEPLLLAARRPTWVARDRAAGAEAAVAAGAQALIMDDGHQNPAVARDLALVVVDGGYAFGNARCLPAGPLREPVAAGLARAQAAVIVGDDTEEASEQIRAAVSGLPILRARFVPAPEAEALAGKRVVAMAGIGRPEKFFDTLRELGAEVVEAMSFPDHHVFADRDIMLACEIAAAQQAEPVTTEKDFVRLPPEARAMISPVPVTLAWEDEAAFDALVAGVLTAAASDGDGASPGGAGAI